MRIPVIRLLVLAGYSAAGKSHATINADTRTPGDEPTKVLIEFPDAA